MSESHSMIGQPTKNGLLIAVDHASNHVPSAIDLGLPAEHLDEHIGYDIGTAAIARALVERRGCVAQLGGVSRLVVDYNRAPDDRAVIPAESDGIVVPGNQDLSATERAWRIDTYHAAYHGALAWLIDEMQPSLILSLHSFTPTLRSRHVDRPWHIGVLYNRYETASKLAIAALAEEGLHVGDQQPYSGKEFNATMDRHAEPGGHPYFGVEIRQDLIADDAGRRRFADILDRCLTKTLSGLA